MSGGWEIELPGEPCATDPAAPCYQTPPRTYASWCPGCKLKYERLVREQQARSHHFAMFGSNTGACGSADCPICGYTVRQGS